MAHTSGHVEAHITHVDREGPFIKVFAQTDKNKSCFVERLLYQLLEYFNEKPELKPQTSQELVVGLICCAKYEDSLYYRAKIENLDKVGKSRLVSVVFIDHGNKAEVKVSDIRLFSRLMKICPDKRIQFLLDLQRQAQPYYLIGIAPANDEWDDTTIEFLRKKLCNNDLKCAVYDIDGTKFCKFLQAESDPVNMLISTKRALPVSFLNQEMLLREMNEMKIRSQQITLPDQFNATLPPPTLLMHQPPPSRLPNITHPPPHRIIPETKTMLRSHPSQSVPGGGVGNSIRHPMPVPGIPLRRPEAPATLLPVQSLQFSTEMLAPGVSHPVYISHVEDGPLSFAVQLQIVVNEVLGKMMADLNNIKPQPIMAPLNPGSICLGRYSGDGSLCRAIVMNVMDDKVKLYFADFGSSEVLPYSEIYQIPSQFVAQKVMSHRFTLANIKDVTYTDHEKQVFKDLVNKCSVLMMTVTPPEANPLKQYCELYFGAKNIKEHLREVAQIPNVFKYTPVSIPMKGSQENVYISFVLNPGRFFVQLDKNLYLLNQMMRSVANHCVSAARIPMVNLRAGEPCCALYEDNKWYRAEILKVNMDNKAFINFVDFGNQEEIELENLRQSTSALVSNLQAQAIVCCLRGYETRYDVEEEISNRLEELILEKTLMMHVLGSTDNSVLIVKLMDKSGQDIGTLLEAKPSQSPIYNHYQATAAPVYDPPPPVNTKDGWEEGPQTNASSGNYEDRKYSAQSEDGKRNWRSREDRDVPPRFNREGSQRNDGPKPDRKFNRDAEEKPWNQKAEDKPWNNKGEDKPWNNKVEDKPWNNKGEDKPWNRGDRFNKEENRGGKFNRDEEGGGRFNRDENKRFGDRGNRGDDDKGGRFGRDSGTRYGKSNDDRGRFNKEDGGFNKADDDKPWKRKDDDSGGWKSKDKGDGNWKERESSGGWGDRKKFGEGDGGFKRGGFNNDSSGDRSSFRKPWEKGNSDAPSFGKPALKSPKPDTVGGMPPSSIKVGMTEEAQVVFTTSPLEFYIQINSTFEELNQLMEKIATACENGDAADFSDVPEKAGCLAKYSEDDTWYRAFVEERAFDTVKVLFVDYGNQENVPFDKIKVLPEDMCTLPVQAIKCRLFGVPESAETTAFSSLVDGKTLKTHFVAKHFSTKSLLVIMVDEEGDANINTAMGAPEEEVQEVSSKLGLTTLRPAYYSPGTTMTTQMTWYLSPSHFYLQPMASNPEFRAMMQSMQSIVLNGTAKQINQLNVGDVVIARFKVDKVLYRAVVQETGIAPKVQYIDFGNSESVESGSVWAMEPEYATLPIQAFGCCLGGIQPNGDTWPKSNANELMIQFDAETLECSVIRELEGDPAFLVKLIKNGEDVAQKIIETGFAVAGSDAVGVSIELDTSLLIGQLLPVVLLRVENDFTFYVQQASEDPELQSLNVGGEGIKCSLSNVREDATEEQVSQFNQLEPNVNIIVLVDAVQADGLQVTLFDGEGQLLALQASDKPSVSKICPMPVLNTHQKVWIAHATNDGIYLHKIVYADFLSELLQKLYDFYNDSEQVEEEWLEGEVCCAKSVNDEQWYRARILEKGDEIVVQYVDYGNSETLPSTNLRKLDASFYTPHAFALKANLHLTLEVGVENLIELAGENQYNAVILRYNDKWAVELVDSSGQSLTDKLIELGFAVALENSPFKRVVEGGRFIEGSEIPISVSFIDSPQQLWVFVGDDIELIEALQDRLQEAAQKLAPLKEPDGIFAAKFSNDDLWYRATKVKDSTVRFIDYGNSDVIDMSDIKALSADFLEPAEGYAVKVELPVVNYKEGATERLNTELISEVDEAEVIAHILSVKESSIVADILKNGKSIVDILVEENLATHVQRTSAGFISHINSLNDFFIQEIGCEDILKNIANVLLTAESFEPVADIEQGNLVVALYTEDGLWYRAKVIETCDDRVEVLFVDYGNKAIVKDFKVLSGDLAATPFIAKHCALQLPDGVSEWSQSANEKFIEISADGCTQFNVKMINQDDPATVVLSIDEKGLIEELLPLCDLIEKDDSASESVLVDLTDYDKIVYVSHINNPGDFYVQLEGAEDELCSIREELADTGSFEILEGISDDCKDMIIGAFYDQDEMWYRAKVLNISEGHIEVLFIDYGNTASASKFLKLPETLINKTAVAIHCALGKEVWSEEAKDCLIQLSGDGCVPFRMKILEETEPNIVSLVIGDKLVEKELDRLFGQPLSKENIEDTDRTQMLSEETAASNESVDDNCLIKTVYLIHVKSPSDFYLHTAEGTQLLAEISERLTDTEELSCVEETCVSEGKIVAAQFDEDDLWYRAKILDHNEDDTKVLFIDYGNTAKVATMKNLPEDLVLTPALAMHCSLGDNDWSLKACEAFNKLANDDNVTFDLKILTKGEPNIVSLYIDGDSVAEQLILVGGVVAEESPSKEEPRENDLEFKKLEDAPLQILNSAVEESDKGNVKIINSSTEDLNDPVTNDTKEGLRADLINHNYYEASENDSEYDVKNVEISHFNNASDFFVQFTEDKEDLMEIADDLFLGNSFETMLSEADILAAKYSCDELWYRAKILDTNSSGTKVLFIDYGNTDVTNEFRRLPKSLAEKKPLAKHCCLKSPRGAWTPSTNDKLSALAKIGGFTFKMKVLEEGDPCYIDLFVGGRSLAETFLAQEMAEKQTEMGEMILQSVQNKIADNLNEGIREITENLISRAVSSNDNEVPSLLENPTEMLNSDPTPTDFPHQEPTKQLKNDSKPNELENVHLSLNPLNEEKDGDEVSGSNSYSSPDSTYHSVSSNDNEVSSFSGEPAEVLNDDPKPNELKNVNSSHNSPNEGGGSDEVPSLNSSTTSDSVLSENAKEIVMHTMDGAHKNTRIDIEIPVKETSAISRAVNSNDNEIPSLSEEPTEVLNDDPKPNELGDVHSAHNPLDEEKESDEAPSPNSSSTSDSVLCENVKEIYMNTMDGVRKNTRINIENPVTETSAISGAVNSNDNEMPSLSEEPTEGLNGNTKPNELGDVHSAHNPPDEGKESDEAPSPNSSSTSDSVLCENAKEINMNTMDGVRKNQRIDIENPVEETSETMTNVDTNVVCNDSTLTPRRSNIDDHIVPGCISSVKLD